MKKTFFFRNAVLLAAVLTGFTIASCGDDDEDDVTIKKPNSDIDIDHVKDGSMSVSEQRERLNAAACKLADAIVPNDFKYIVKLRESVQGYAERYKGDAVQDWFEDLIISMTKEAGESVTTKGYENSYSKEKYTYNYYYHNYTQVVLLSNFKGHFFVKDGAWVRKDASVLQFDFVDHESKDCTLTLSSSGRKKKVYVGAEERYNDYDWDSFEQDGWSCLVENNYYDLLEQYVEVPEKMTLTLKQGSKTMAELVVNVDLSSMKGEEFDITNDKYNASGKLAINQYSYETESINFDPSKNVGYSVSLKKDGEVLIGESFSVDGNYQREEISAVNVCFDLMGEVQIRGKIKDAMKFAEYISTAKSNDDNKSEFTSYIDQANEQLNLGVYYDGKNVRQARVVLEVFEDTYSSYSGGSRTEYYCQPVVYFGDDTKYTDTEVFFGSGFDKAVAKFENLLNELVRLN